MTVEVERDALVRAWRRVDFGDLMWELAPRSASEVDRDLVGDAMHEVNEWASAELVPDVFCEGPFDTGRGVAGLVQPWSSPTDMEAWFDGLRNELEKRGVAGRIGPAQSARMPKWVTDPFDPVPTLTAIVGLHLTDEALAGYPAPGGCVLAEESVQRAAEVGVEWSRLAVPATTYLSRDLLDEKVADFAGLAAGITRSVLGATMTGLTRLATKGRVMRHVGFGGDGTLTCQAIDDTASCAALLDNLLGPVRALGPDADLVSVRYSHPFASGWNALQGQAPETPYEWLEARIHQAPSLRTRWVPDAYGAQVLTDDHLAHARDLSGWTLEDLGNGRHLVIHPDLEAWFGQPVPDRAVLERARDDFDGIIITPDVKPTYMA